MRAARAALFLTQGGVLRLLREPLVVRALVWPAALLGGVPFVALALAAMLMAPPEIAVSSAPLAEALRSEGFTVIESADPEGAFAADAVDRAIWRAGDTWVLGATHGGWLRSGEPHRVATLRAEGVLRATVAAPWRLEVPAPPERAEPPVPAALHDPLGAALGLLFVLYGAVVGVGSLSRDRSALEVDRTAPVPAAIHAGALWAAGALVLAGAHTLTLTLVRGQMPLVGQLGAELLVGACGAADGVALGLVLATGRLGWIGPTRISLSRGLSAALVAAAGLAGVGLAAPEIGRWLPIASVSAAARMGAIAPALQLLRTALVATCAAGWIHRQVTR